MGGDLIGKVAISTGDWAVMIGYMVGVVVLGAWFSRKEKTSEDYLLGGRKIPWLAVGISFMMSLMSTYSLVMVPGEIFNHGISLFVMSLIYPFILIGSFALFMRFYFKLQSFTPFEYLGKRYGSGVRNLVSIVYMWTRMLYLGMVLFSTSKVFEGGAGWPAWITISVIGIIGILYTVMGGMKAVIWTDVLQFFVMAIGLGATVVICTGKVDGGFMGIINYALEHGRGPSLYAEPSFYTINPYMRLCFWLILVQVVFDAFFYTSADQISVQRLLSTSSYTDAKKAIISNAFLAIPFMLVLWVIGFAIFSYYGQNPDPRITSGDTALFTFISTQLPTPLPGFLLAAMLAAAMSTLDSGMNSLSAVCVKEYCVKLKSADTESGQVVLSRIFTVVVGVLATSIGIIIASSAESLRQSVVEAGVIFNGLASILVPIYLLGVTTSKANSSLIWRLASLVWGINFGMITWYLAGLREMTGPISPVYIFIPLIVALVMLLLAFILSSKPSRVLRMARLFPSGYALSIAVWYLFARYTEGGALSFQWTVYPGILVFVVFGYIGAWLSPANDPEKYEGLTLATADR